MPISIITSDLLDEIISARHELHKKPELSESENDTATYICSYLCKFAPPDNIFDGIGGTGVVAVYNSGQPGPTVLFRAELDALPVQEVNDFEHKSQCDGVSHKCGHDGHMATLLGLARVLKHPTTSLITTLHTTLSPAAASVESDTAEGTSENLPITKKEAPMKFKSGRVVLLFQPAEEIGVGAAAMLADPTFNAVVPSPDLVFGFHNVPGHPRGAVILKPGVFTASVRR
jgi:metal-dependent amidase/aminoacylase/carboxypeptidase family protein